ncbi:MAG: PilZ domain-containing protein [Chloroflexota bacterium]|nr:PilZ domain-containing protein [Chloroflexota bacterium]
MDRLISDLPTLASSTSAFPHDVERRHALRVDLPFPATVRGIDATGERFTVNTQLDNLSACGLYLRLQRPVEPGAHLLLVVRLSTTPYTGPHVALRGTVLRTQGYADGRCGVAVAFDRHRFLYVSDFVDCP